MGDPPLAPQDQFEAYYAEKIWELIPENYRNEDGLAQPRGVLRALVEILAQQAAVLRRSQDRLWEDQFIEWCGEWAVPYLGDLVGTRMVSALNPRARRVDVAKTIYYRRRKGTLRVLEELISDIAGWDGKAVEEFKHLGRARHGLDAKPLAAPHSGTLPGGWADIRRPLATQFATTNTAFDEFFYTPDMRQHRGFDGRKNIPKLAFHLYRLASRTLIDVTPHQRDTQTYTFDPSGRDVELFNARARQTSQQLAQRNWEEWQSAQVWELPLPIPRRVLGHAEYQIEDALSAKVNAMANPQPPVPPALPTLLSELRRLRGQRFVSEDCLLLTLKQLPSGNLLVSLMNWPEIWKTILAEALVSDCGKKQLISKAVEITEIPIQGNPVESLEPLQIAAGDLSDWSADCPEKPEKLCVVDPKLGRIKFIGEIAAAPHRPQKVWASYHYGFPGPLGAGTYERQASLASPVTSPIAGGGTPTQGQLVDVAQIEDSLTYGPIANPPDFMDLTIQTADGQRPYMCLEADWVFTAQGPGAHLTLEGLWIGSRQQCDLVLRGDFENVIIRHCTLDPGGKDCEGHDIFPVRLIVEGRVDCLLIDASVTGPILLGDTTLSPGAVVKALQVQDSILQSLLETQPALDLQLGEAHLERTTILGSTQLHRLWASDSLAAGTMTVVDAQNGCFRFSAALVGSRLPHPYESHILQETNALFTSTRFGHWRYAQVAESAPDFVRGGAENGSELGAYCACFNPIKLKSLQVKVGEYMPFGLIPIYIPEV